MPNLSENLNVNVVTKFSCMHILGCWFLFLKRKGKRKDMMILIYNDLVCKKCSCVPLE